MTECPQCGYDVEQGPPANITFVYATRMVWFRKKSVRLTQREMEIFEHLFDAGRRGCTADNLCEAIYAERDDNAQTPDVYVLAVHLSNMRRKLREIDVGIESTGRGDRSCRYSLSVPKARCAVV